jgi:EmrB/QacA subfamily drug resistance transporter
MSSAQATRAKQALSSHNRGAAQKTTSSAAPVQFTHQQIRAVVIGIMLSILLAALDQTVVIPAVPAIAADLNGFGHLSWIVSAYLLTSTAATPIYGKLSDMFGRRQLLIPALIIFVITSVLCGMAQSLTALIIFRALQGIGGAGLMAISQAAIADVVSPRERGRYQGYLVSMWGLASIAGPVVGGYMTDHLSWRWIFWMNLPLGIAAIVLSNRALKLLPAPQWAKTSIDYVGASLLTGSITALLLVMSWGGSEYPWGSATVLITLAVGVVLLVALIAYERRIADPLLPPRVFANSVFVRGVTIGFFASLALFGGTFMMPLFFQLTRGSDASTSGWLVLPFLGANVVGAFLGGQLSRRLGRTKIILVIGLSGVTAGFATLALLGGNVSIAWPILAMLVLGVGLGAVMPTIMVTAQNAAELRDVGVATGSLLLLRSMGGAFGSTLVGAVLTIRFGRELVKRGVTQAMDMGALRESAAGRGAFDEATRSMAQKAVMAAFHFDFGVCAGLMMIAVLAAASLRDIPLRTISASSAQPVGH